MASVTRETLLGVWGFGPQWSPGATPLIRGLMSFQHIGISGLEAAILDLLHPVWSDSNCTNPIRLQDLENVGLAVGILFLYHLEAEI